jgi:hypothetical protein
MLGYSSDELLSIKFRDLIAKEKFVLALPDMMFNEKGEIVVFNGKVVSFLYLYLILIFFKITFDWDYRLNFSAKMVQKLPSRVG